MAAGRGASSAGKDAPGSVSHAPSLFATTNVAMTTADLLAQWKTEAQTRAIAQQAAAVSEAATNRALGIAVTVLAAIGGTSAFASLLASTNPAIVAGAGVFTIAAAALSGMQTYLGLGESSGAHRSASASFLGMENRLEVAIALHGEGKEVSRKELEGFANEAEALEKETRPVSEETYRRASAQAKRDEAP